LKAVVARSRATRLGREGGVREPAEDPEAIVERDDHDIAIEEIGRHLGPAIPDLERTRMQPDHHGVLLERLRRRRVDVDVEAVLVRAGKAERAGVLRAAAAELAGIADSEPGFR